MLTFLIGLAGAGFLLRTRWGRPVAELQVAGIAGFTLPIAGALVGGLGSGNVLIQFGAETGSVLADLLVYAWGMAGAAAGFGAAWGLTHWILEEDAPASASAAARGPGGHLMRGGTTLEDVPGLDDLIPTGPMMPALAGAAASGEYTPPSGVSEISFPF